LPLNRYLTNRSSTESKNSKKILFLFGPTAVGKTELLLSILPENAEVISVDSLQVYTGMDIGTAKPEKSITEKIPHHLLDLKEPSEQYTVGEFVHRAEILIENIIARGNLPVLSGGCAYYFKNLILGLPKAPPSDPEIRQQLRKEVAAGGIENLLKELEEKDPESAAKIHKNDIYRITRALEIIRLTQKPFSSFKTQGKGARNADLFLAGLFRPREELYKRINHRVDMMIKQGLVEEVRELIFHGYGRDDPGLRGIGYREFLDLAFRGCGTVSYAIEEIKLNSRHYAKRQITFFRSLPGVRWYQPEDPQLAEDLSRFLNNESADLRPWL